MIVLAPRSRAIVAQVRGGQGPTGSIGTPGGNIMAIGLFTAASGIAVPGGTNMIRTSGYSVDGKGQADYEYDATVDAAYVAANPQTSFMSANGRGFKLARQPLNFFMFGGLDDDDEAHGGPIGTDNSAAMNAALAYLAANGHNHEVAVEIHTQELIIPVGYYYFASAINLKQSVKLRGGGSKGRSTRFRFAANINGIVANTYDTIDDTTEATSTRSSGTVIEGLYLVSLGGATGHGIRIRDNNIAVRDVWVQGFPQDGIHIAGDTTTAYLSGNANLFHLENVTSTANGRHGVHLAAEGTDGGNSGNAGFGIGVNASHNAGGGIVDHSFLGAYWFGAHAEYNGNQNFVNAAGPTAAAAFGGAAYYVRQGQEVAASTTQPGTDANVWVPNSGLPLGNLRIWVSGMTWLSGGPYLSKGAGNAAQFIACYAEGGQPPTQLHSRGLAIGGYLDFNGFDELTGSTAMWAGEGGHLRVTQGLDIRPLTSGYGLKVTKPGGAGGDAQVVFNVDKDPSGGASFALRRSLTSQQVFMQFDTGDHTAPDGFIGSAIGSVDRLWLLGGNGSGGSMAIDQTKGLLVGDSVFSNEAWAVSPTGTMSFRTTYSGAGVEKGIEFGDGTAPVGRIASGYDGTVTYLSFGYLFDGALHGTDEELRINPGHIDVAGHIRVGGTQVVGAQQGAIANHASDATVNAILSALRTHGLIAT